LDAGETSILEYNRTQIYLLNLSKELETIEMERRVLLEELARLNGGMTISFSDTAFSMPLVLPDFEQWYAQVETINPMLQWLKQELTLSQKQKQLQAAQNLPKFSAGYMSEKMVGEQFQGVMLGVSIPLWENRNTIKRSKAKVLAAEEMYADAKLQYYNQMKTQFYKVTALQSSVADYRKSIEQFNNCELSEKALKKGELSLGDYYIELSFHYESIDRLLEMEHKANLAYYELQRFSKL
jgi:outer membrane protein TolC